MATTANAVVRRFLCLMAVVGLSALPAAPAEQSKEQITSQMVALAAQLTAMKADLGAGDIQTEQYKFMLAEYRRLSEALGGDDPCQLMVESAAGSPSLRSAPTVSPDPPGGPGACTATTASFSSSPGTLI